MARLADWEVAALVHRVEELQARDEAAALRRRYALPAGTFSVALVGKDGHVARREKAPMLAAELEGTIDAMPMRRLATADEVAEAVLFLATPASAMTTGHTLPVDGGFLSV